MIPALRGSVTEFRGQRVDELAELPEGAWVLRGDRGLTYSPSPAKRQRADFGSMVGSRL
jgi:putative ABC transport system permease protein